MVIDSGKWVVERSLLHILGDPIVLLSCLVSTRRILPFLGLLAFVFTLTGALHVYLAPEKIHPK